MVDRKSQVPMNSLVAIDPIESKGQTFERFCEAVKLFQDKGLFSKTVIASTVHPSLYVVPYQWYREMKEQFADEALSRISTTCEGRFAFASAKVLQSSSPVTEDLVLRLARFGRKEKCDLLIIGSNNRKGLPHWILGSFAETAALTSILPVLIIKPHWKEVSYSRDFRLLVAIDIAKPPSPTQVQWIRKAANRTNSIVDLVYVEPSRRVVFDAIQTQKKKGEATKVLKSIQAQLRQEGVSCETNILDETKSLAYTLTEFANEKRSWLIVTTNAKRSLPHRLLLGSTARRLLSLTERPFLSLRMGPQR